jgi:hypothetical protein
MMRTSVRALLVLLVAVAAGGCPDRDPIAALPDAMPGLPDAPPLPDARPDAAPRPACSDFLDNDNDGFQDFPFDPGCISDGDTDESDGCPNDPSCPACANGIDDDGDGWIDAADPGCAYAADVDEYHFLPIECGPSVVLTDITASGTASDVFGIGEPNSLESPTCHGTGAERVYVYAVVDGPATLTISTDHSQTDVDTVLYLRTVCQAPDSELACDDDGGDLPGTSLISISGVEVGTYYIIVDAFSPGSLGDFFLTVDATVP